MPKWKRTATEKAQEREKQKRELLKTRFGGLVGKLQALYCMTQNEVAENAGLSPAMLSRRLAKPEKIRLEELQKLSVRYSDTSEIKEDIKECAMLLV